MKINSWKVTCVCVCVCVCIQLPESSLNVNSGLKASQCHCLCNMQHQMLWQDEAELLLSVSESVSSPPLLDALWPPGLDVDVSMPPGGSGAPLFWQDVWPPAGGLLINVGMLCRKFNYCIVSWIVLKRSPNTIKGELHLTHQSLFGSSNAYVNNVVESFLWNLVEIWYFASSDVTFEPEDVGQ